MKKIFLLLILNFTLLFAQNTPDVIATVGNQKISTLDFKSRYELMPRITENKDQDSLKKEFIYSMIGEKLWAMEAINQGLDKTDYFQSIYEPLEKMYYKDALFREDISSKIKIEPDEIARGIFRSRIEIQSYIFSFRDSVSANQLYASLKKNVKIDSLLSLYKMSKENIVKITYGVLDDLEIENAVYKLRPG
ncbi:MAG: hypothetical protein ACM3RX_06490, partial [Methanococcaceae archaeon]